jgi:DNA adenine methylase
MLGQIQAKARPFVKWAGGKGQLLTQLEPFFPERVQNYFEPFVGGGAVFFDLEVHGKAHINDINQTLVNAYQYLKKDIETITQELKQIEKLYLNLDFEARKAFYYERRSEYNSIEAGPRKTILLIFLNRTCFNGLYRENSRGEFNVPMGNYANPRICDEPNLRAIAAHLKNTEITSTDYKKAVSKARAGDFVYFDPPYVPLSATASFTSYNKDDFSQHNQEELSELFKELDKRGCLIMLSNSKTKLTQQLYKEFRQKTVYAGRNINARGTDRGKVPELIVTNYE